MIRSAARTLFAAQQDPNSYEFNTREYLEKRSEWQSGEYLQKNIYDNVAPKIVTCGDTTMMVWLDDNSSRADADFQTLYYSVLQNGVWSEPIAVCDNGTFDCEFDVYTDGKKIYVIYTEMTSKNTGIDIIDISEEEFSSFAADVEVSVIIFENGKFGTPEQITDNEACEILPRIATLNGYITAIWSATDNMGLTTGGSGNDVYSSMYISNIWSNPNKLISGQNTISDMVSVNFTNGSYTAYIVDSDNSAETNDDQALIIYNKSGNTIQVDSGLIMNVETARIGSSEALLWYNNGKIYMITSSDMKPICLVPESACAGNNYQVVNLSNGKYLLTFVMGNTNSEGDSEAGSDIYGVYIDKNGFITDPVRLTNTSGYVQNYSVVYLDGKLVTVFTETFADVSGEKVETTTHLRTDKVKLVTDIKLNDVNFDIDSAKPESDFELTLSVSNKGTFDVYGLTVNIYNKSTKELITTIILNTYLKSGATVEEVISFILPEELCAEGYVIELLPCDSSTILDDEDLSDNTKDFSLTYADMSVSTEQKIIGEKNYIILNVTNNGNIASKVDLKLYLKDVNGELLSHISSDEAIAPGETQVYTIELGNEINKENNIITCVAEAQMYDPFSLNNSESLTIFKINEDVFVTDPDEVNYNPEISITTAYFDKREPSDIYFFVEECMEYFSGISGFTLNGEYTLSDNSVCIKKEYLNSLEVGNHTLKIVFDFGNGNIIERTLDIKVSDTRPIALEGSVSIIGDVLVGETVYVGITEINANNSGYSVEWLIDDVVVGTGNSYTVKPEDNAKTLFVVVNGRNGYSGILQSSEYITLRKPNAPATPIISKITSTSVTIAKTVGVEYSLDLMNWQDSNVFEGLAINSDYVIYARVKATETSFASDVTSIAVTTPKKPQTRPSVAPKFAMLDYCSITLAYVEGAEYKIEGGEWTDNNVFLNLNYNTTYKFYQRYKETEDTCAGEIRTNEITTMDKIEVSGNIAISGKPQCGATLSVDLTEFVGYEYSVTYQWYCDGVEILGATESIYKVTKYDIGKTVSVTVFGDGIYKGSLSAEIQISNVILGDVNHDNNVDETDAEILRKYVAKWENITIYEPACDINSDGVINIKDVTILKRHLANWPGYEDLMAIA